MKNVGNKSVCVEYFFGENIELYLQFLSFLNTEMTQFVEI